MREIKFRALADVQIGSNLFNRQFVYGGIYVHDDICSYITTNDFEFVSFRNGTLGQFTGLKDKNGVDIYEGDILTCYHFTEGDLHHNHEHIVQWSNYFNGWFALNKGSMDKNDGSIQLWVYMKSNHYTAKVIGNIHQNPELLENQNESNKTN